MRVKFGKEERGSNSEENKGREKRARPTAKKRIARNTKCDIDLYCIFMYILICTRYRPPREEDDTANYIRGHDGVSEFRSQHAPVIRYPGPVYRPRYTRAFFDGTPLAPGTKTGSSLRSWFLIPVSFLAIHEIRDRMLLLSDMRCSRQRLPSH